MLAVSVRVQPPYFYCIAANAHDHRVPAANAHNIISCRHPLESLKGGILSGGDLISAMYIPRLILALCLAFLFTLPVGIRAQQSTGTINGVIRDKTFLVFQNSLIVSQVVHAHAELVEVSTWTPMQRAVIDTGGSFTFYEVPYGLYYVHVMQDSASLVSQFVRVASSTPVNVDIEHVLPATRDIIVTVPRYQLDPTKTGSSKRYTSESIRDLPVVGGGKSIETVLLNTPGVVPDEDGRLHVRGEDAQLQYVIDGIPITTNLTRVYSSLFNSRIIKSIDIQTGGLNAEYGVAAAGVIAITTKSGFDAPTYVGASGETGSFSTTDFSFETGGHLGDKVGVYLAADRFNTGRYLDPIAEGNPIHSSGSARHAFAKVNAILSDNIDLVALGSFNATAFDIPNSLTASLQNQHQDLNDYMIGARLNIVSAENSLFSVLAYKRHANVKTTSGGLMRIATSGDSVKAVVENEKFFIGAERTNDATGGQIEFTRKTDWFSVDNTLRAGIAAEIYPIDEFFTFAVVNPALSNPDTAGGDIRYRPYDITQGGSPFLVDQSKTGKRFSGYVQDRLAWDKWTLNVGIRMDMFDLFEQELAFSPRLSAAYAATENLVLRASYSRVVMQAPLENILVSSSDQARILTGAEQGTTPTQVRSEKSHSMELGAAYKLNDYLSFDVVGYGKLLEDFIVKSELGNSGIIFPINLKEGLVAGGELRADLHNWNNLSASLAISGGVALGLKPEDGSSPVAAGLILGEEGDNYSHPFGAEEAFPTEHSQLLTSAFTITYNHPIGVFATLGGRFDMGLPFDLADTNGNGLTAEAAREELLRRGYSPSVIDLLELEGEVENGVMSPDKSVAPHAIFDIAAGYEYRSSGAFRARLTLTVTNLLDTPYLYKFESSFGGTHFGQPRMLSARVAINL